MFSVVNGRGAQLVNLRCAATLLPDYSPFLAQGATERKC